MVAGSSHTPGLLTRSLWNPETQPIPLLAGAPLLWFVAWEGATGSGNRADGLFRTLVNSSGFAAFHSSAPFS